MSIGIEYEEFWHMNPHIVKIYIDASNKREERQAEYDNYMAHLQGIYFADALNATVGNMFRGKGQKPYEYPKQPYKGSQALNEEEINKKRELLLRSLQAMATNFELNKNKL